ncbi:TldD/PmbA family protein [candidate division CSSED10-310 bacterium]|uniref:TldD/PmbA family protein n=1 Tax=candidate division CSSED10-310 bacterium TaxID=2855610 RepID=A0ABV6YWY6_UNCC1
MNEFIEKAQNAGCSEVETFQISKQTQGVFFTNGKINDLQAKESTGIALRVKKDDKLGFIGSSNLQSSEEIIEKAVVSTQFGENLNYSFPTPAEFESVNIYNEGLAQRSIEDYIPRCETFIKTIQQATDNISVDCFFEKTITTIAIQNSNGLDCGYMNSLLTFYSEMRLTENSTMFEIEMQLDGHDSSISEQEFARKIVEEIPYYSTIKTIKPGKRPVLFTPECFGDLFLALETGLRGSAVVKGISPLTHKIGEQIFDERINIIDDSTNPQGKLAAPFDDEGTPGQKTYLVRNGILENFICDLKSATALDREPTGNGYRYRGLYRVKSYTVKPGCDFSNVIIQPGKMSVEDMIKSIDEGVLVQAIGGLLLANLNNGDYSGTISQGLKIEKGKIVGRVTNAMITGNFYHDFRHNLVALAHDSHWLGAFSGQIGAFNIPYALLKDITISSR